MKKENWFDLLKGLVTALVNIGFAFIIGVIFQDFYVEDLHLIWQILFWCMLIAVSYTLVWSVCLIIYCFKKTNKYNYRYWNTLVIFSSVLISIIIRALLTSELDFQYLKVFGSISACITFLSLLIENANKKKKR